MKKTDLLNAIDAFVDSRSISSHVLKSFAENHLRAFLEKLPDEIKEIEKCCYPDDNLATAADRNAALSKSEQAFSKLKAMMTNEACACCMKQAEYED